MKLAKPVSHLIFALLLPMCAIARDIYTHPQVGAGVSGLRGTTLGNPASRGGIATCVGINAGIRLGNFRTGLGLSVLNSSYHNDDIFMESSVDPSTGQFVQKMYDLTYSFTQVLLMLNAGYEIGADSKVSITPEISIGPGYNAIIKSRMLSQETGEETKTKNMSNGFNSIPIYGRLAVHFTYRVNDRLGITLAPVYSHELNGSFSPIKTSILTPPGLYAITGNIGVMLNL